MNTPMHSADIIPMYSAFRARAIFPAPAFCATKADMDCMNAEGTSMMKAHTRSAHPTPAEAMSPRELTMAMMTRKEIPTRKSCSAMGKPSRVIRRITGRSGRTSRQ